MELEDNPQIDTNSNPPPASYIPDKKEKIAIRIIVEKIYEAGKIKRHALRNTNSNNYKRLIDKKNKHEIIQTILETYTDLINSNRYIILIRVPSHQGIPGNRKAISYAKQAANSQSIEFNDPILYQELFKSIHNTEKEELNRIWKT